MSTKYPSKANTIESADIQLINPAASTAGTYAGLFTDSTVAPNIRYIDHASLYNNTVSIASLAMRIVNAATTSSMIAVDINCSTGGISVAVNNMTFTPTVAANTTAEVYPGVYITTSSSGFYNITFKDLIVPRGYLLQIKANTGLVSYHLISSVRSVV
jgi:hypothetical protein